MDGDQLELAGAFARSRQEEVESILLQANSLNADDWNSLQENHASVTSDIINTWTAIANQTLGTLGDGENPTLVFAPLGFGESLLHGNRPRLRASSNGKNWHDYGRLTGVVTFGFVVHLPGHWVLLVVDIAGWTVTLWDSNGGDNKGWPRSIDERCLRAFFASAIPHNKDRELQLLRGLNTPRQHVLESPHNSGANCGIYVIEFCRSLMKDPQGSMIGVQEKDMVANRAHIHREILAKKLLEK